MCFWEATSDSSKPGQDVVVESSRSDINPGAKLLLSNSQHRGPRGDLNEPFLTIVIVEVLEERSEGEMKSVVPW